MFSENVCIKQLLEAMGSKPAMLNQTAREKGSWDAAAGHDPIGLRHAPSTPRGREADKLKDASERFYQPLLTGTRSLSQEQLPSLYPGKLPSSKLRPVRTKQAEPPRHRLHSAAPRSITPLLHLLHW